MFRKKKKKKGFATYIYQPFFITTWSKIFRIQSLTNNYFVYISRVGLAEARRRKFFELYPEAATNQEPVLFRSSIIPWWAWLIRSYLPEAELLNGYYHNL